MRGRSERCRHQGDGITTEDWNARCVEGGAGLGLCRGEGRAECGQDWGCENPGAQQGWGEGVGGCGSVGSNQRAHPGEVDAGEVA